MASQVDEETGEPQKITFADLGIRPREAVQSTPLGKYRNIKDVEVIEWIFVCFAFIGLVATFVLTLTKIFDHNTSTADRIIGIVLLINCGFGLYYVVHAILREQPYELLVFIIGCIILFVYLITNIAVKNDWNNTLKLLRFVIAAVMCPVLIALSGYIAYEYSQSNNLIFRILGATVELQAACRRLFQSFSLLSFDLQLQISLVVLFLNANVTVDTGEAIFLAVGIPVTIIWSLVTYFTLRFEAKHVFWGVFAFGVLEPAYILYKIVLASKELVEDVNQPTTTTVAYSHPTTVRPFVMDEYGLSVLTLSCACSALFIRCLLLVVLFLVQRNFGLGIRQKVYGSPEESTMLNS